MCWRGRQPETCGAGGWRLRLGLEGQSRSASLDDGGDSTGHRRSPKSDADELASERGDTRSGKAGTKKPPSPVEDERCRARGTTSLRRPALRERPLLHGLAPLPRFTKRCIGPITGAARPEKGHPSPPTVPGNFVHSPAVRSAAPRSSRLACSVPLRSCRGSLARPGARLPVLIVADSVFTCPLTLASARWSVKPSICPELNQSAQSGGQPPNRSRPRSCCHQPAPP